MFRPLAILLLGAISLSLALVHHPLDRRIPTRRPCGLFSSNFNWDELYSRMDNLQKQEALDLQGIVDLPVICWDALLPHQRLQGSTQDPTLGRLWQTLGVGGLFGMVSLDYKQRKVRRDGVLCKITIQDAPTSPSSSSRLTAVDFALVGLQRCRIVGPDTNMQTRIGRWRRIYDPDGEESVLGWGMERFVDRPKSDDKPKEKYPFIVVNNDVDVESLPCTAWSNVNVQLSDLEDPDINDPKTIDLAQQIPPLLQTWQDLASNITTYENTDVVATVRYRTGYPGLRVHPDALLRQVQSDLTRNRHNDCWDDPTELALYGAALINPIPALGVAPEIRGRVLSAPTALQRLQILKWGIQRSIGNLQGTSPL